MIKQRTMWWVAAVAVAGLCSAGAMLEIYRDYRATRDAATAQTDATVRLVTAHAERSLGYVENTFDRIGEHVIGLDRADAHELHDLRHRLQDITVASEMVGTIWLLDRDGRRWLNNLASGPGSNVAERPYFADARAAPGKFIIGAVETGTVVPRPRFTISRSLTGPDGSFQGVMAAGIDIEPFSRLYAAARSGPMQIAAFNRGGDLLARTPDMTSEVIEIARKAMATEETAEDSRWITSVMAVRDFPMVLVALTDFDEGLAGWRARSWQVAMLSLLMLSGFLLLAQAGARSADRETQANENLRLLNDNLEERVRERTQSLSLLLRELNHRVKNNLQIVGSLIRLQARTQKLPEVSEILERTNQRLFAVADLHSELETGETGSASSRQFFQRIARRVLDATDLPGRRIMLCADLDDIPLPVDRAVPLGLILNELVTNSVKHAFTDRLHGCIAVTFKVNDGVAELRVADDGGSMKPRPASGGIGSQIIAMLARQIQGVVTVTHAGGREVRVVAPMAPVTLAGEVELPRAAE
jgi:two-component sensor histidine kinase